MARGDHLLGWSIVFHLHGLGSCGGWVGLGFTPWYLAAQAPLAREPDEFAISHQLVASIGSNAVSSF